MPAANSTREDARGHLALELRPLLQGAPFIQAFALAQVEEKPVDVELRIKGPAGEVRIANGDRGLGETLGDAGFAMARDAFRLHVRKGGFGRAHDGVGYGVARRGVGAGEYRRDILGRRKRHLQAHDVFVACAFDESLSGEGMEALDEALDLLGLGDAGDAQKRRAEVTPKRLWAGLPRAASSVIIEVATLLGRGRRAAKVVQISTCVAARGLIGGGIDLGNRKHGSGSATEQRLELVADASGVGKS